MNSSHYGLIVLFLFTIVIVLSIVFILIKKPVKPPPQITPDKTQQWVCDSTNPNQCVATTTKSEHSFSYRQDCVAYCQSKNNGFCEWTATHGYTGKCQPNMEGSDGLPIKSRCSQSSFNSECNTRKTNQTMYCNGVYCKGSDNPMCTTDNSLCVNYSCCHDGVAVNALLPPSQVGATCRALPEVAKCTVDSDSMTYYWCDPTDSTCKSVTQPNIPVFSNPSIKVSTNPKTACLLENTDCWRNVYWRQEEKMNPETGEQALWCNWSVATRGTSPGTGWVAKPPDQILCGGHPVLNSGWCFSPPTNPNDASCTDVSPNLPMCVGSVKPVNKVFSCNMGDQTGNSICQPNAQPSETSYTVGKSCCPQGAYTLDGKGDTGGGTACLPILPGCSCFNSQTLGKSSTICPNQVEWDENCYDRCEDPCQGDSNFSALMIKKCRSEASVQSTEAIDASICKNSGECMCRIPPVDSSSHQCDGANAFVTMCGSSPCTRPGCVGCTVTKKTPQNQTCTTDSRIANHNCNRTLNAEAGDGNILMCPDGSDCQVGDAVVGTDGSLQSRLLSMLKAKTYNTNLDDSCINAITPLVSHCVNDPKTACVPLSTVVKGTELSNCVTYNSMANVWKDENAFQTYVDDLNRLCGE